MQSGISNSSVENSDVLKSHYLFEEMWRYCTGRKKPILSVWWPHNENLKMIIVYRLLICNLSERATAKWVFEALCLTSFFYLFVFTARKKIAAQLYD